MTLHRKTLIGAACALGLAGCGGGTSVLSHSSSTVASANSGGAAGQKPSTGPLARASVTNQPASHSRSPSSSHHTSTATSSSNNTSSGSGSSNSTAAVSAATGLDARFGRAAVAKARHAHAIKALPPESPFIRAADAICSQYRQEVAPLGHATSLTATEQIRTTVINDARSAITQLQALSPPGAAASTFQQFTSMTSSAISAFAAAQTQSTATAESAGVAVETQDYNSYTTAINDAEAAAIAAQQLGFRVCGSAGSDWL